MTTEKQDTCCCPKFDPASFDETEITWKDKIFVKEKVWCLFYIPLNFGGMTNRVNAKLSAANARPDDKDIMTVQRVDPCSPWVAEVYISATKSKDVPDLNMTTLSGTFLTKVYEGPYKNIGTWVKEMHTYVKDKKGGKDTSEILAWYPTCPKCAKKYGKNYVVMLANVE